MHVGVAFWEVCILEQRLFKMVCLPGTPDYYCLKSTKKIVTHYELVRSHTLDYYTRYYKQAAIT